MSLHRPVLLLGDMTQPTGSSLEVFQMEKGVSTNIIEADYDRYETLATGGWWKQFWCLCHRYDVQFQLGRKCLIRLLRVGDKAIMDLICATVRLEIHQSCQEI